MDFEKQSIGTEDFAEHIRTKKIYIDKTSYLPELYGEKVHPNGMRYEDKVLLITRPRRFGKSLTMSMIKNFFELNYANPKDKSNPKELFQNLAISKDQDFCDKYMGEYPVISISLNGISGEDYIEALTSLLNRVGDLYKKYEFLKERKLPEEDELKFSKTIQMAKDGETIAFSNPDVKNNVLHLIKSSLRDLTSYLYRIYNKKVIVIIDEYDVPLQKATANGYYNEMLNVIRGMFESVFKTNEYLEKGIVTGCLRISHESIFTGINNFSIYTVNDEGFNKFIGFTHDETVQLLKENRLISRKDDVMKWYDGYNFSGARMLCPWSVLNFCEGAGSSSNPETFAPQNYWINTSGNDIMRICITKPNAKDSMRLQNLLDDKTEMVKPTDFTAYPEINYKTGFDVMMGMMIHTGYLTVLNIDEKGNMEVKIPNNEIKDSFRKSIEAIYCDDNIPWFEKVKALKAALFKNDKDEVQRLINELLINFVSVRDSAYENFYHGFLLGILSLVTQKASEISSNKENGKGFSDLILKNSGNAVIIEFKKMPSDSTPKILMNTCTEALKQIEDNKYDFNLQQDGYSQIIKYGITFYGKECWVATP
ncbi:AAA family ATPase [Succinivibrio dextrinosolvens]|nr:AAA family ATPase [Succinivibrio dextrinosolvens]